MDLTQFRNQQQMLPDHFLVVYVIAPSWDGPCKIGITNNLQRRLIGLQGGCWEPLSVFSFRLCIKSFGGAEHKSLSSAVADGARIVEKLAHAVLKNCDLHLHGEWFDVSVDEARAVLEKCGDEMAVKALKYEDVASAEIPSGYTSDVIAVQSKILKTLSGAAAFVTTLQPYPVDRIVE